MRVIRVTFFAPSVRDVGSSATQVSYGAEDSTGGNFGYKHVAAPRPGRGRQFSPVIIQATNRIVEWPNLANFKNRTLDSSIVALLLLKSPVGGSGRR